LVREAIQEQVRRREANEFEQARAFLANVAPLHDSMDFQRLCHCPEDALPWIQRVEWILKDHLDGAVKESPLLILQRPDRLSHKANGAGCCWLKPDNRTGQRRLAAATLAHNSEDLAMANSKVDPVDRSYRAG
jgi:hypothetical protein